MEFKEDCANERDRRAVWQSSTKEGACKTKQGMPLSKKEKGRASSGSFDSQDLTHLSFRFQLSRKGLSTENEQIGRKGIPLSKSSGRFKELSGLPVDQDRKGGGGFAFYNDFLSISDKKNSIPPYRKPFPCLTWCSSTPLFFLKEFISSWAIRMLSEISLLGTKESTLPRINLLFQEGSHPLLTRIFEKTL